MGVNFFKPILFLGILLGVSSAPLRAEECGIRQALSFLVLPPEHAHFEYHQSRPFDFYDPVMTEPRSKWGKLKHTLKAQGRFANFELMHRSALLTPVFKNSPAAKNLEVLRILEDINRQFVSIKIFEKEFINLFDRIPGEMDYIQFYVNRLKLYKEGMARFFKEVNKVDRALVQQLQKIPSLTAFSPDELKIILLDEQKKGSGHLFDAFHELVMDSKAHVGELHSSVAIPNVKKVSFHLNEVPEFENRLKAKLKWLGEHPEEMEKFTQEFPHILNNKLVRDHQPKTLQEKLALVDRWLHHKEFDLLSDGMIVEVKRNAKPLNAEDFGRIKTRQRRGADDVMVEVPRSGSLYDQAIEAKEMLNFLGIEKDIKYGYFTTNGVTDEVRKMLSDLNIEVIH